MALSPTLVLPPALLLVVITGIRLRSVGQWLSSSPCTSLVALSASTLSTSMALKLPACPTYGAPGLVQSLARRSGELELLRQPVPTPYSLPALLKSSGPPSCSGVFLHPVTPRTWV